MEDYKANSHKSKSENTNVEKKEIKQIANGKVRKKSGLAKAADKFVNEDVRNVKSYILIDVLIPAAKKAITDIVSNGIEMLLYGETRSRRSSSGVNYISYDRFSSRDRERREDRYSRPSSRYGHFSEDIILETRGDAEEVLCRLNELIETYEAVSVADLYDLVGITGEFTDNNYGWTNIRNARIESVRDGYLLIMPKAGPID